MLYRQHRLHVVPLSWNQAQQLVDSLHRHHKRPRGHKLSIGVALEDGTVVGVAVLGRPVASTLDDGTTLEVTRVATDGTGNANSCLYGAARRIAREMGYRRVITYTEQGESGASLRGAGWRAASHRAARDGWNGPARPAGRDTGGVARTRWEVQL
jgi:hypothetical protein